MRIKFVLSWLSQVMWKLLPMGNALRSSCTCLYWAKTGPGHLRPPVLSSIPSLPCIPHLTPVPCNPFSRLTTLHSNSLPDTNPELPRIIFYAHSVPILQFLISLQTPSHQLDAHLLPLSPITCHLPAWCCLFSQCQGIICSL